MAEETVSKEAFDNLVRNSVLGSDMVASRMPDNLTMATRDGAIVRAALHFAVGNGLVKIVPFEEWPSEWLAMDPGSFPIKIEGE